MKLVFSRHGESEANVQPVYWSQPGRFSLTPRGRQQAAALAGSAPLWSAGRSPAPPPLQNRT